MIKEELLKKLRPITPEEQRILSGETDIQKEIYMSSNSGVVEAEKLLESGKLISLRPHTRFAHFPEHRHDYVEMVYMCYGSTEHIVNGKKITLREGELLLLGQGARQEIMPCGESDIAVNFIVLPRFFDTVLKTMDEEETPLRRFITDSLRSNNAGCLHFKVSDVLPVQNLIELLIWALTDENVTGRRSFCRDTMGLLFTRLIECTGEMTSDTDENDVIVKVLKYIEDNYTEGNLSELAFSLHYDLYWLSREIKRKTGKTYKELLQEKRLAQAAWYLKHTGLLVDEIGEAVGYSNMSYFHRIFFEKYGATPKKYRDG